MYVCVYTLYICMVVYVCIYACMCMCVYVYIYIYIIKKYITGEAGKRYTYISA